jgi:hypothetical protein
MLYAVGERGILLEMRNFYPIKKYSGHLGLVPATISFSKELYVVQQPHWYQPGTGSRLTISDVRHLVK